MSDQYDSIKRQDLVFTIPKYETDANMPELFKKHVQGMPQYTTVSPKITRADQTLTDADINKIFDFNGAEAEDPVESTLTIANDGEYWKDVDGQFYGFQFGVATKNDIVEIKTEDGATILPRNTVFPNSLSIITRISPTTWLIAGGNSVTSLPTQDFILNQSLMGSGDIYA